MKIYFTRLIALLCCAALLTACQDPAHIPVTPDTTETVENTPDIDTVIDTYQLEGSLFQYHEGRVYMHTGNPYNAVPQSGKGTLTRYNPETGNITAVCPDPLCSHDTMDCPFVGKVFFYYFKDNSIYYIRKIHTSINREPRNIRQHCCYDIESMKMTVLHEEENDGGFASPNSLIHNGYWYFYESVYIEETQTDARAVVRINLSTKKREILLVNETEQNDGSEISEEEAVAASRSNTLKFAIGDRLYFSDLLNIYSTTTELTDKTVHFEANFVNTDAKTDGTYVYASIPAYDDQGKSTGTSRLHRFSLETGEETDLGIEVRPGNWYLTEQYIYFDTKNPLYLNDTIPDEKEEKAGNIDAIWRCRHDGSGLEKVFDLYRYDETGKITAVLKPATPYAIAGDTIYAYCGIWEDTDGSGTVTAEDQTISNSSHMDGICYVLQMNLTDGTYEVIQIR